MVAQEQSNQELRLAFAEEAEEAVRYLLYAEQAQREGYPELSTLFAQAAQRDALEYARIHARLLGEVGTSAENLALVIRRELADCTELYPALARHAAATGDEALAAHLWEIAAAKKQGVEVFHRAYAALQEESERVAVARTGPDWQARGADQPPAHGRRGAALPDFVPASAHRDAAVVDAETLFLDDLADESPAGPFAVEAVGTPGRGARRGTATPERPVGQGVRGRAARRAGALDPAAPAPAEVRR
jgi:rubrerythrin